MRDIRAPSKVTTKTARKAKAACVCYLVYAFTAYESPDMICVFTAKDDAADFCARCNEHHQSKPPFPKELSVELEDDDYTRISDDWDYKTNAWRGNHPAGAVPGVEHVDGFGVTELQLHTGRIRRYIRQDP